MGEINKQAILSKTHYGIGIYAHILELYYPGQTVLSLSGRTCSPAKNPLNADKPTLNIFIEKENILGNAWDKELARHLDSENAIPAGDAFDFAELHYKQSGTELLQTLNKEMNLHIGEKFNFYKNRISNTEIQNQNNHNNQTNHSSDIVVRHFSFFKAPVRNTIPHKSISLLDAYNYIVGDYAKQRTEKLRSIKDPKQARQFKASTFDYCTFSGMFQTRNDKALISHSGLLCIDFDHLQNVDLLRKQLLQDEYFDTQMLFVSPSGDGLKWIIPIDTKRTTHSNYFAAVANYILQTYGVEVDKSGRDISRACFLPHDPQAFINPVYLK
ncbi:MAG: BT4734/BF3469 family protein [Bacteroidales bacterium]|nr:BT4734/BF3469 family protein [Eubacteriales bacterium]MDD4669994.1 BT4734/BF3469 family protein [Bacteroidales bacterium]